MQPPGIQVKKKQFFIDDDDDDGSFWEVRGSTKCVGSALKRELREAANWSVITFGNIQLLYSLT